MVGAPPLKGIKVIEFAGLAPGPFAGMLLADSGASVLRIDRAASPSTKGSGSSSSSSSEPPPTDDMLARHKSSITVDLKSPRGVALVRRLASQADVLIDPFRPGVLERLGLGPGDLLPLNRGLVYARMTGFRRDGRYRDMAGHDINYLAVSGALDLLGREGQRPHAPWNILGDFAGGGASLFQGILLALLARGNGAGGKGQVVEANMVDGASYLATFPRMALHTPLTTTAGGGRGRNLLDGGAPFYDTYETKDGLHVAVGALEPRFFARLLAGLGLGGLGWEKKRDDPRRWAELRGLLEETFRGKTRAEWEAVFDGTDACCVPVLSYSELEKSSPSGGPGGSGGPGEKTREGDQRPPVALSETPMLAQARGVDPADAAVRGQGEGVEGGGYRPTLLRPGHGGEAVLADWLGWQKGKDYVVEGGGGLALNEKTSKL
ncbi:hypothetical protein N3K66_006682 [Trichothecium roseum]|uniref:Uncharacterized protein n=1 Tax=Trichothecium roseum TaxID=47278 RepID=A0ACC0UXC0_9HYPO|nr:hypothetical protein N3K66_006682 [Trichothecium roseum]